MAAFTIRSNRFAGRARKFTVKAISLATVMIWSGELAKAASPPGIPAAAPRTSAVSNAVTTNVSESAARTLNVRLAEARANLAATMALGDAGATNLPAGVAPQDFWLRRALLHRLVRLYEQQLSNVAELESTRARKAELARQAQAWTRFEEPAPYSIVLADRLNEELQAERTKVKNGDAAIQMLNKLIDEQRAALAQAEERIRQINEQLESTKNPTVAAGFSWRRELERLRSQVATASVALFDSDRLVRQEVMAESRLRMALLQRQLVVAEAATKFTQNDLDQVTARLERERQQLERELADALTRRDNAARAVDAAREELRLGRGRPETSPGGLARAEELVAVRSTELETADTGVSILRTMLELGNVERPLWELRFAVHGSRNVEKLRNSWRRLNSFNQRLALWQAYARQQVDVSSSQIQLQETRLNSLAAEADLRALAGERLAALRARDQVLLRFARAVDRVHRLTDRWAEELHTTEGQLPIVGRVQTLFSDASSFLQRFWTFEVFTAEDTITVDGQTISGKRSITIGKIVMAVLILVVGYWVTGVLSKFIEPFVVKRLKIEPNQANLIRRWFRVLLVVGLVMFSLVSVKIPLTVFAFAGGALAIGLGFGMQTMLKNFVSGIILLFERPFRVGDVLDVGGQRGTVTSIGLRASVLQLWDGIETLIPNSSLLENNVSNWTYSDRKVRFIVTVGVAYGSDPRQVIQLLSDVAERHGLVEKDPKPQVFFTEFGSSTLIFELRFWVDVAKANAAQVSSDLRIMIAGTLAEHGIRIDFPQRDIHLHAGHPLQVQVVPGGNGQTPTDGISKKTIAASKREQAP